MNIRLLLQTDLRASNMCIETVIPSDRSQNSQRIRWIRLPGILPIMHHISSPYLDWCSRRELGRVWETQMERRIVEIGVCRYMGGAFLENALFRLLRGS